MTEIEAEFPAGGDVREAVGSALIALARDVMRDDSFPAEIVRDEGDARVTLTTTKMSATTIGTVVPKTGGLRGRGT